MTCARGVLLLTRAIGPVLRHPDGRLGQNALRLLHILFADEQLDASVPEVRPHATAGVGTDQHDTPRGCQRAGGEIGVDADEIRPDRDEL